MQGMEKTRFIDDYLSYLLAQASYVVYKEFDQAVRAAGLSSLEWRVLATLSAGVPISIGDLAREVLAQQPTLTKLVQRMRETGWVRTVRDASDQRRTQVSIAPAGRAMVRPLLAAAKRQEAAALAAWADDDIAAFKARLRVLIQR